jgi:penicillin-binding protein 1C
MIDVSGVDGAGPIWRDVMLATATILDPGTFDRPPAVVEATVCDPTGLAPGAYCPFQRQELFVAGTEPAGVESYYTRSQSGAVLISPPAEARAWAMDAGLDLAPVSAAPPGVRVVSPAEGATLFLAPELKAQEVLLRASAGPSTREISFSVNGVPAGTLPGSDVRLPYLLGRGTHRVMATATSHDGTTTTATTTFEVKAP